VYDKLIIDKLDRLHVKYEVVPGSEWVKCVCINPDHDDKHPSAGVNVHSAIFNCFSCGHTEKFIKEDDVEEDEETLLWNARYAEFTHEEDEEIFFTHMDQPPIAHMVTEEWRGISPKLLGELAVYYCDRGRYRGRYVFGMHKDGMSVGFDARIVDDTARMASVKWIRPKGMLAQSIVYPIGKIRAMGSSHLVITEGVMDAVSYIQMGVAAIPSFGISPPSSLRIEQLIALGIESVSIAFDNDEAGRMGALKVLPYYSKWFDIVDHPMVAMIRNSEYKDANEFLVGVKMNGLAKQEESWTNDDI